MDQLMHWRSIRGMPATAVNWGSIGGIGMAAAQDNRGKRFESMGFYPIQPAEFDHYFKLVFQTKEAQLIPMKIDFDQWSSLHPSIASDRTFMDVLNGSKQIDKGALTTQKGDWGNSMAVASRRIQNIIKEHLTEITKIAGSKLKEDDTFKSMGLDSMLALQLKNKIQASTDLKLPVSSIWAHPTIDKYTGFLLNELRIEEGFSGDAPSSPSLTLHHLRELVKDRIAGITKCHRTGSRNRTPLKAWELILCRRCRSRIPFNRRSG